MSRGSRPPAWSFFLLLYCLSTLPQGSRASAATSANFSNPATLGSVSSSDGNSMTLMESARRLVGQLLQSADNSPLLRKMLRADVSPACTVGMLSFIRALRKMEPWAVRPPTPQVRIVCVELLSLETGALIPGPGACTPVADVMGLSTATSYDNVEAAWIHHVTPPLGDGEHKAGVVMHRDAGPTTSQSHTRPAAKFRRPRMARELSRCLRCSCRRHTTTRSAHGAASPACSRHRRETRCRPFLCTRKLPVR
ncbi:hypothetical protein HPB50_028233 [Hyalomma asiaticum]|nr:hypothetical protein HPB50_028233 [Hyalomma asiaticum]